jgi:hypothetical protein
METLKRAFEVGLRERPDVPAAQRNARDRRDGREGPEGKIEASPRRPSARERAFVRPRSSSGSWSENPFKKIEITVRMKPYVTFTKDFQAGPRAPRKAGTILGVVNEVVCSVVDLRGTTPDLMQRLDKEFGRKVTTRNWATIAKIVKS